VSAGFDAEYVVKVDDDVYLRLDRLPAAAAQWAARRAGAPRRRRGRGGGAIGRATHCSQPEPQDLMGRRSGLWDLSGVSFLYAQREVYAAEVLETGGRYRVQVV